MARILIANDNSGVNTFLKRSLERAGHAVVMVKDGLDALVAMDRERFDLLLTDVAVPGVDGVELAKHASFERPNMQVMLITGFSAVALRIGPTANGNQPVPKLSRPFHLRQLAQHVDVVLSA
jgi:Response regulator containing CheY-like receiver, AAA-type ATPase, and DNA-binding domains